MKTAITLSQVPEASAGPFVLRTPLPEAFATAAQIGFNAVELFLPSPDFVSVEEVKSLGKKYGLSIAAVGTGAGWLKYGLSLTDPSPGKRETALEFVLSMVRFGGHLKAPAILGSMQGRSSGDALLGCNRYTLQNTSFIDDLLPRLQAKGIGTMSAGPFSARLLTNAEFPGWLKEPEEVKAAARAAAKLCADRGVDIAQLALQFSCEHPDLATTVAGSANPANIRKWAEWLEQPIDHELLADVLAIFPTVRNLGHLEGLPQNN